ncbi:MAG: DUF3343 domain-containing protein [Candidatus Omnitrophica bacterium]|nr:DUF3343 domain-containing protein [Candidatus Omnitrophota bacterium]
MFKKNSPESCVITFSAVYHALKAEKHFKGLGFKVKLIPVPRQISSNCGIALEFNFRDRERLAAVIQGARLAIENIYPLFKIL